MSSNNWLKGDFEAILDEVGVFLNSKERCDGVPSIWQPEFKFVYCLWCLEAYSQFAAYNLSDTWYFVFSESELPLMFKLSPSLYTYSEGTNKLSLKRFSTTIYHFAKMLSWAMDIADFLSSNFSISHFMVSIHSFPELLLCVWSNSLIRDGIDSFL